MQLTNTFDAIMAIWLANHHISCLQPPSKASWAYKFINYHMFLLVSACCVYNKSKNETVLMNFAPMNFSLCLVFCLDGANKLN